MQNSWYNMDEFIGGKSPLGGLISLLMYLLRHDTSGALTKDKDGFVKVDDLVKHPNIKNKDTVMDDINKIIEQNNEKGIKMFELKGTGASMKIKAFGKEETVPSRRRRKSSNIDDDVKPRRKGSRKSSRKGSRKTVRKGSRKGSRKNIQYLKKNDRNSTSVSKITDLSYSLVGGKKSVTKRRTSKKRNSRRSSKKRTSTMNNRNELF